MPELHFRLHPVANGTFIAELLANSSTLQEDAASRPYDDQGALFYVVIVILIYGFSIVLMIGSLVRKNRKDRGLTNYLKDMDRVRQMERRQLKFQARIIMAKSDRRKSKRSVESDFSRRSGSEEEDLGDEQSSSTRPLIVVGRGADDETTGTRVELPQVRVERDNDGLLSPYDPAAGTTGGDAGTLFDSASSIVSTLSGPLEPLTEEEEEGRDGCTRSGDSGESIFQLDMGYV